MPNPEEEIRKDEIRKDETEELSEKELEQQKARFRADYRVGLIYRDIAKRVVEAEPKNAEDMEKLLNEMTPDGKTIGEWVIDMKHRLFSPDYMAMLHMEGIVGESELLLVNGLTPESLWGYKYESIEDRERRDLAYLLEVIRSIYCGNIDLYIRDFALDADRNVVEKDAILLVPGAHSSGRIVDAFESYKAGIDSTLKSLIDIKEDLSATQKNHDANFVTGSGSEGSALYQKMAVSVNAAIDMFSDASNHTPQQLKAALVLVQDTAGKYYNKRSSELAPNQQRVNISKRAMNLSSNTIKVFNKLEDDMAEIVTSKNKIRSMEKFCENMYGIYDNEFAEMHRPDKAAVEKEYLTMLQKSMLQSEIAPKLIGFNKRLSGVISISRFEPEAGDRKISDIARDCVTKQYIDSIYDPEASIESLMLLRDTLTDHFLKKKRDELARDPLFEHIVRNNPKNCFYQRWQLLNADLAEAKNRLREELQKKTDGYDDPADYIVNCPEGTFKDRMSDYIITDILADPKSDPAAVNLLLYDDRVKDEVTKYLKNYVFSWKNDMPEDPEACKFYVDQHIRKDSAFRKQVTGMISERGKAVLKLLPDGLKNTMRKRDEISTEHLFGTTDTVLPDFIKHYPSFTRRLDKIFSREKNNDLYNNIKENLELIKNLCDVMYTPDNQGNYPVINEKQFRALDDMMKKNINAVDELLSVNTCDKNSPVYVLCKDIKRVMCHDETVLSMMLKYGHAGYDNAKLFADQIYDGVYKGGVESTELNGSTPEKQFSGVYRKLSAMKKYMNQMHRGVDENAVLSELYDNFDKVKKNLAEGDELSKEDFYTLTALTDAASRMVKQYSGLSEIRNDLDNIRLSVDPDGAVTHRLWSAVDELTAENMSADRLAEILYLQSIKNNLDKYIEADTLKDALKESTRYRIVQDISASSEMMQLLMNTDINELYAAAVDSKKLYELYTSLMPKMPELDPKTEVKETPGAQRTPDTPSKENTPAKKTPTAGTATGEKGKGKNRKNEILPYEAFRRFNEDSGLDESEIRAMYDSISEDDLKKTLTDILALEYADKKSYKNAEYLPVWVKNTGNKELLGDYLKNTPSLSDDEKLYIIHHIDIAEKAEKYQKEGMRVNAPRPYLAAVNFSEHHVYAELPDIKQKAFQSSGNGCWSCVMEMMLQSLGIEDVTQEDIRGYRPKLSVDEAEKVTVDTDRSYNSDCPANMMEMADNLLAFAPNKMMRQLDILSYDDPARDKNISFDQYMNNAKNLIKDKVYDVIKNERSPIGFWDGGHYLTIVGIDGDNIMYKNSSRYSSDDPNTTHTRPLSELIGTKLSKGGRGLQFTWMADIKLAKDEKSIFGVPNKNVKMNSDGSLSLPPEKQREVEKGDTVDRNRMGERIYSSSLKNAAKESLSEAGVFSVEKAYLPKNLNAARLIGEARRRTEKHEADLIIRNKKDVGVSIKPVKTRQLAAPGGR